MVRLEQEEQLMDALKIFLLDIQDRTWKFADGTSDRVERCHKKMLYK